MSSDGQISVSVNAEGTEDAVGQLGDNAVAEQQAAGNQAAAEVQQVEAIPGGDGGDGGGGGGRGGGGRFGKLLTRIAGLLAFLGPILKVLGVVSNVVEAFVAPLAIILLRLLQPVLMLLLQALPFVFDIAEGILSAIDFLARVRDALLSRLSPAIDAVESTLSTAKDELVNIKDNILSLPGDIVSSIEDGTLASDIGSVILDALPNVGGDGDGGVPDGPGDVTDTEEAAIRGAELGTDALGALGITPGGPAVNIALEGGLDALVNRIERDPNKNV